MRVLSCEVSWEPVWRYRRLVDEVEEGGAGRVLLSWLFRLKSSEEQ